MSFYELVGGKIENIWVFFVEVLSGKSYQLSVSFSFVTLFYPAKSTMKLDYNLNVKWPVICNKILDSFWHSP